MENISTTYADIGGQYVQVYLEPFGRIGLDTAYRGKITVKAHQYISEGVTESFPLEFYSENRLTRYHMMRGGQFKFVVGDELLTSYDMVDPNNGVSYREVLVPTITYGIFEMPSFDVVTEAWSNIDDDDDTTVADALAVTGGFVGDFISYATSFLGKFLPWNSVVYSDEIPIDETAINIPWRNSDGSIKTTTN
ncbi:MAG: hypothetical protein IJW55_09480 [Clostridia bacterium]|nr:hypothetical protein [Clostridia bacterium]